MKKLLYLFLVFTFLSCGLSTMELEEEIKQNMIEHFAENDADIELVSFGLVHKGGNEYKGLLELVIPNTIGDLFNKAFDQNTFKEKIEVTYSVNVIYDGESYSWEVITD